MRALDLLKGGCMQNINRLQRIMVAISVVWELFAISYFQRKNLFVASFPVLLYWSIAYILGNDPLERIFKLLAQKVNTVHCRQSIINIVLAIMISVFVFVISIAVTAGVQCLSDNIAATFVVGIVVKAIIALSYAYTAERLQMPQYEAWYCHSTICVFICTWLCWMLFYFIYTYAFLQILSENILWKNSVQSTIEHNP
jgi:hypothetical protein